MNSRSRRPSEEALSKALGAFNAFNAPALELAVTSALMRNEGALGPRAVTPAERQARAGATA